MIFCWKWNGLWNATKIPHTELFCGFSENSKESLAKLYWLDAGILDPDQKERYESSNSQTNNSQSLY